MKDTIIDRVKKLMIENDLDVKSETLVLKIAIIYTEAQKDQIIKEAK